MNELESYKFEQLIKQVQDLMNKLDSYCAGLVIVVLFMILLVGVIIFILCMLDKHERKLK